MIITDPSSVTETDSDDTLFTINIHTNNDNTIEDDDAFEFPLYNPDACPITADQIFSEGKIRPMFIKTDCLANVSKPPVVKMRRSLRLLFTEDEEFERGVAEKGGGMKYCEWAPTTRKSGSTGTSKRWKLPRMLRRCSSDGRNGFGFYREEGKVSGQNFAADGEANVTVLGHYPSKKMEKYGNRRTSYLPYKQDLIGLFSNISNKPGG